MNGALMCGKSIADSLFLIWKLHQKSYENLTSMIDDVLLENKV